MNEQELDNYISLYVERLKRTPEYQEELRKVEDSYENLYSQGYHFYENGQYKGALTAFHKLVLAHPFEAKYWFSLAATLQEMKEYDKALHAWSISALIDSKNPYPHFHAAEALYSLERYEEGALALREAQKRTENTELLTKISALLESTKILQEAL